MSDKQNCGMFVSQNKAQEIFDNLPPEFQYPTLDPTYVEIDCEDTGSREPLFWTTTFQGKVALISSGFGSAIDGLYDIESQRGYGGGTGSIPFDSECWQEIWRRYFSDATQKKTLANFVRFTPLLKNYLGFEGEIFLDRYTVAIDLDSDIDPLKIFETRARTAVRKAIKNSVSGKWAESNEDWHSFIQLYNQRMDELKAGPQYRFSKAYFDKLAAWKNSRLLLSYHENELISGAIFLTSPKHWDYHLSASNRKGMKLCATQWIIWNACVKAQSEGVALLHLGGGTDNKPDNPLFFFKRGFSKLQNPFYFGKQILNPDAYDRIKNRFKERNLSTSKVLFYREPITEVDE